MKARAYKSGTKWCLFRWTEVPSEYIVRLHVIKTPWFAVCLHWLVHPDPEPWLHDHPVSFLSIILRGGYEEKRQLGSGSWNYAKHKWFNFIRATPEDRHTITHVKPNTVTLCLMGPKRRTWGYHTDKGWVDWVTYNAEQREIKKMIAEAERTGVLIRYPKNVNWKDHV